VPQKAYPDNDKHIIEAIFILGNRPEPTDRDEENRKMLDAVGARYMTYDELIRQNARKLCRLS